jgi:mRNA-degrading endonuclease RelE of RelBE toxin-antitoxin system
VNGERYEVRFQRAARRAIAERLPESVAAAVLEFCDTALALSPRPVGKPLFGPLAGCHGAWRGTYRVIYRIDEQAHVVEVLDIDHRSDIYHRPLTRMSRSAHRRMIELVRSEITRSLPSGLFQHGGGLVGTPSRLVQIG